MSLTKYSTFEIWSCDECGRIFKKPPHAELAKCACTKVTKEAGVGVSHWSRREDLEQHEAETDAGP